MVSVHEYSADGHNEDSATDDDQRVCEELCTSESVYVIPCSPEWGEDVDKQKRKEEQEYQICSDIVLGKVVIRYLLI